MPSRSLKGSLFGSRSLETEEGVEFVPRFKAYYKCEDGHDTVLVFAAEATVPKTWQCRCGKPTILLNSGAKIKKKERRDNRSHWDIVRERRSIGELDKLLQKRLKRLDTNRYSSK